MRPPRMILLGVEKIGKSTFASKANTPIFIPIKQEEGIDALNVAKFPVCNTLQDVQEAIGVLCSEDHEYQTVVIDSASALEPVIWDAVCTENNVDSIEKVGGGYGKGYIEALERWREIMEGLDYLRAEKNMASIIIGHVKVKRFDDPERDSYDQYQFDINEKVANALYRWADFIGFANTKVMVKEEKAGFDKKKRAVDAANGNRFLLTQKTPAHPGGGRGVYGQLPHELPLDWQAFQDAVSAAMNQ
jgi:hypothetical protein